MKLKASERRLLVIFLSLFAVIVGGFGVTFLVRHFGGAVGEVRDLAARRDALERMLGETRLWGERSRWIDERIPSFASREDASSRLLDSVSEKAEAAGVEIRKKQLLTNPNGAADAHLSASAPRGSDDGKAVYFDRVAVILELAGDEEKILRWLHRIQQPGSFLGVTHLTYLPTDGGIHCSAQVSLWFREPTPPNIAKSP